MPTSVVPLISRRKLLRSLDLVCIFFLSSAVPNWKEVWEVWAFSSSSSFWKCAIWGAPKEAIQTEPVQCCHSCLASSCSHSGRDHVSSPARIKLSSKVTGKKPVGASLPPPRLQPTPDRRLSMHAPASLKWKAGVTLPKNEDKGFRYTPTGSLAWWWCYASTNAQFSLF